jgi:acetolactate decarboxylase
MTILLALLLLPRQPAAPQTPVPAREAAPSSAALFQVSTLDALLSGVYNGEFSIGELKKQGDFGLGTYAGLDGEMIVVDGHYFHMRANGLLTEAADDEIAPFAAVTRFRPGVRFTVNQVTADQLSALLDSVLPSKNYFYAIRIRGAFPAITTRAIPLQFLPYPPLSVLIPSQSVFSYSNVTGTMVDIRSPAFVTGINQPGHHYHFVSADRKAGGHALSFTAAQAVVEIQTLRRHTDWLPPDEPFRNATLPYPQP